MRSILTLTSGVLFSALLANPAVLIYTDLISWQNAAGSFATDDFTSAPLGGPQPSYVSPLGATLTRSATNFNNGRQRTTTVDYSGFITVTDPPPQFSTSPDQVFISGFGEDRIFAGADDSYSSTSGFDHDKYTRTSDGATRHSVTQFNGAVNRTHSAVSGEFDNFVLGFGFSLLSSFGPYPGSLALEVNGQEFTIPVTTFIPFLGVLSDEHIDDFKFTVIRPEVPQFTEGYNGRPCFAQPTELCTETGVLRREFSSGRADITEMFVAPGLTATSLSSSAVASTPEPSTGLVAVTALLGMLALRSRFKKG